MSTSARVRQHVRSNVVGYVALAMCLTMAPAFAASVKAPKDSVTSKSIKNGQVKAADLAASSVGTTAIVNGTIGSADVNSGQVQLRVNASCSAGSSISAIAANGTVSCETDDEGSGAPSGPATGDLTGSYPAPSIAGNAVTSAKILDGTVTAADILDGTISGTDIANGSIGTLDIGEEGVGSSEVEDFSVTATDLATGSVTSSKIVDATIATADLADSSVTGAKVADLSLGGADIAENTVHANRLVDNTVASNKLQDNTVLGVDIDESTLDYTAIQKRVTGSCAVGSSITSIAANGSVTCGPLTIARTVRLAASNVGLLTLVTIPGWGVLKCECLNPGDARLFFKNETGDYLQFSATLFDNDSGSQTGDSDTFRQISSNLNFPNVDYPVLAIPSSASVNGNFQGQLTIWRDLGAIGDTSTALVQVDFVGFDETSAYEFITVATVTP